MIKVASYNCNSIRCNIENVKDLLKRNDIVALQELMLLEDDLGYLSGIDSNMSHTAFVRDNIENGINTGRPSKGVALFWNKSFTSIVPLKINEWLIGIIFESAIGRTLILNVYLPYDNGSTDSIDNYRSSLAIIESVLDDQTVNNVCILGDFNADPQKGRFWSELLFLINNYNLIPDINYLSNDSFTYLSPAHNTTSWLDHILCSQNLCNYVSEISINYDLSLYDHFPVEISFNVDLEINKNKRIVDIESFIDWDRLSDVDKDSYRCNLDRLIGSLPLDPCFDCNGCDDQQHKDNLSNIYQSLTDILLNSSDEFSIRRKSFKAVPGWNAQVKELYKKASLKFLTWKNLGKPSYGLALDEMKESRNEFKNAFRVCKNDKNRIINEKIALELQNRNTKKF